VLGHTDDVRVTNLDALTYAGNLASLADVADDPRYRFVHGDVRDAELVDRAGRRRDAVVHFAAESHVDRSIDGPAEFLRHQRDRRRGGVRRCRRHEVERVLHISTDEVYGSIDEPGSFVEGDALEPNSPYSASKAAADLLARSYRVTYGYPITVTRTANNFGPYHYPEKVIPLFVTNLIDGRKVPLYGDGATCGTGPTCSTTSPRSGWCSPRAPRRGLQRRCRQRADQPRADLRDPRAVRRRRGR
jgi:dTDP-glucose 4,6-dehydratase